MLRYAFEGKLAFVQESEELGKLAQGGLPN